MSNFFYKIIAIFYKSSKTNIASSGEKLANLDKKLVFSLSKSRIPSPRQFKYIKKYLSKKEIWLLRSSFFVIIISLFFIGFGFYATHLRIVPISGGEYTEALVGSPKNINPLYAAANDVDHDISQLIFSSLFKRGKNGELLPDLVESYTVSPDNKIYTLKIRDDVFWHNDSRLTVDDIIFTFNAIKDAAYKSPLRTSFAGVTIEAIDGRTIKFILPEPYAAFLDLLSFGIMPAESWYQIPPESANLAVLNLKPIGSGPYKFDKLIKDEKSGKIKEYYLIKNKNYYNTPPLIDINFKFYPNFEEAITGLNNKEVLGINYLPPGMKKNILTPKTLNFHKLNLPQLTAIFFNQKNNKILADKKIRQALWLSLNRLAIVQEHLNDDAYVVDGPILPFSFAYNKDLKRYEYDQREAEKILDEEGWKLATGSPEKAENASSSEQKNIINETEKATTRLEEKKWRKKDKQFLTIKLTTINREENKEIVKAIKDYWERIGVKVDLRIIPGSKIQSEVIKPRNFEALFYGQVTGLDPDPYAFWHSSQVGENGFNIPNFANKEVDKLLEDARLSSDIKERTEKYKKFQNIIAEEIPAIFMYSPIYTYPQGNLIKNFEVNNILYPSDRFANVSEWYIKTGKKLIW